MINSNDLYAATLESALTLNGATFGTVTFRYEIRQVTDVRNLSHVRSYRVLCTQRISIPNKAPFSLTPSKIQSFDDYPALLTLLTQFSPPPGEDSYVLKLLDYTPRTLNTTIMTSANSNDGTNSSYSRQHTSGSSTSQTNSYGANVSLGFFGDAPTGSIGGDFSHSTTTTHETSDTRGRAHGNSHERGSGESMSIKDWGSYAYVDLGRQAVTWVWGQEYPWDVIQFRCCPTNNAVELPAYVLNRLFDTSSKPTIVMPPSQLSLFGVDFTMKATWQIDLPGTLAEQVIQLSHAITYLGASHGLDDSGTQYVTLNPAPAQFQPSSPALDLTLLGLDPVPHGGADNGAVVGFTANKFVVPPSRDGAFKILSGANNLQVVGSGFNAGMVTDFSEGAVKLSISFKITDEVESYTLFIKHWKTTPSGCTLNIVCNGDSANPLVRHVDDPEGAGGANNLLAVNLRNKDYSSIDYHDYLVPGLNTIAITVEPNAAGAGYQLRALAIGGD